jgi:O-antigen ligase
LWDPYAWSSLTTGRLDLWIAGIRKFADYPVFGAGAGSWRDDLSVYLPEYSLYGSEALLEQVQGGAYHNAFVTLLAEKGLVAFGPGLVLLLFILRTALRAARGPFASAQDAIAARIAPALMLGILASMMLEGTAFFAAADGPGPFLAFALGATVVALDASTRRFTTSSRLATRLSESARRHPTRCGIRPEPPPGCPRDNFVALLH